jgi:hypothetical protein
VRELGERERVEGVVELTVAAGIKAVAVGASGRHRSCPPAWEEEAPQVVSR